MVSVFRLETFRRSDLKEETVIDSLSEVVTLTPPYGVPFYTFLEPPPPTPKVQVVFSRTEMFPTLCVEFSFE